MIHKRRCMREWRRFKEDWKINTVMIIGFTWFTIQGIMWVFYRLYPLYAYIKAL